MRSRTALWLVSAAAVLTACGGTDSPHPQDPLAKDSRCSDNGDKTADCSLTLWHCGITEVNFEGLAWQRPLRDLDRGPVIDGTNVPRGWVGNGTMTLVDSDEAVYVDESGEEVPFRPADQVPDRPCA